MNLPSADVQYNNLVRQILTFGDYKTSRGGAISNTYDYPGPQMVFDLRDGFPLLTTKKVVFQNVYHELMWMLRGETNINTLKTALSPYPDGRRRTIWDQWADENGDCGPIYGYQWRHWPGSYTSITGLGEVENSRRIDQISGLLHSLTNSPDSRRHIVTAWNPDDLFKMALPPCHCFFQCFVNGDYLDLKLYQRSADVAIGVPYNMASYALLLTMLAEESGLTPRRFIHSFGSAHIYEPHVEDIKKQIEREPTKSPALILKNKSFWDLVKDDTPDDYKLVNYNPHKHVSYSVEV